MSNPLLGFVPDPITVPFDKLLPAKKLPLGLDASKKYLQIKASIESIGLIEPLTIGAVDKATGMHVLRDGHIRVHAMKELDFHDAPCLIAIDDESYTYNNRVNRLSTIQEHLMIRRAVDRGVTPERIANDLKVDISHIQKKLNLLDGICAEAAGLLKDQRFSPNLGAVIRKMKPTRQIECVELMVAANNVTTAYANAMLAATPAAMLVTERKPHKMSGISAEQMTNALIHRDYRMNRDVQVAARRWCCLTTCCLKAAPARRSARSCWRPATCTPCCACPRASSTRRA